MNVFANLLSSLQVAGWGLFKSMGLALLRHFLTGLGLSVVTWLVAHHADPDQAKDLVNYTAGAILTGAGILWGQKNEISSHGKVAVAAAAAYQQGVEAQSTTDQSKVQAVAQAMQAADKATPQDKAAVVAALKAGTF